MPIYEYECRDCGHRFDRRQHFDDPPIEICPVCQGKSQRVIHSVAVIYKGSGFYTTDYGRSGNHSSDEKKGSEDKVPEATKAQEKPSP